MSLVNDALKRARQAHRQQAVAPEAVALASVMPPLQPVEESSVGGGQLSGKNPWLLFLPLLLLLCCLSTWFLWQWSTTRSAAATGLNADSAALPVPQNETKNPLQIAAATVAQVHARAQNESEPAAETVSQGMNTGSIPAKSADEPAVTNPIANAASASTSTGPITTATQAPIAAPIVTTPPTNTIVSANSAPSQTNPSVNPETLPMPPPARAQSPAPVHPLVLTPPKFKLQGIFYRVKNPTALINDRIVSIGDSIEGYRVTGIERQSVNLSVPGYTNVVTLY